MQASSALDILLVDDDRPLREMLTRSFEREGHRVTAVADGETALAAAQERTYAVARPRGQPACPTGDTRPRPAAGDRRGEPRPPYLQRVRAARLPDEPPWL